MITERECPQPNNVTLKTNDLYAGTANIKSNADVDISMKKPPTHDCKSINLNNA